MSTLRMFVVCLVVWLGASSARADAPAELDPYWVLLHEQAVVEELKLSGSQQTAWQSLLDGLDLRFFPLRNQSGQEAAAGQAKIVAEARAGIAKVITPAQQARLDKIWARQQGFKVLLSDDFVQKLKLSAPQQEKIKSAVEAGQASLAKLREEAKDQSREALNQEAVKIQTTQRDAISEVLTNAQKLKFRELVAGDFDLARLGHTHFQPPELIAASSAWRNSPPLTLAGLKGKVVVVHFFAFGCINCIHNYPVYQRWQRELAGQGVTLIGVHTPETDGERNVAKLEGKLKSDALEFPILIDNDKANWNAWGNNVWPAVYILDKQGDLRYYWPGELNWQGTKGEEIARGWIAELLAE
jgi:thiol-disulfide isomerase/thioredoxin